MNKIREIVDQSRIGYLVDYAQRVKRDIIFILFCNLLLTCIYQNSISILQMIQILFCEQMVWTTRKRRENDGSDGPLLRFCKQAYQFPFPKITPKTWCKHGWLQFSFVWLTIRAEYWKISLLMLIESIL